MSFRESQSVSKIFQGFQKDLEGSSTVFGDLSKV